MRLPLPGCLCGAWGVFSFMLDIFFSHRVHRVNRAFSTNVSSPQDSGPSPNPSPTGRGVICEVTPIGLLTRFLGIFFSHRTHRFNRTFQPTFRAHRRPSAYRYHRTLQLSLDVTCVRERVNKIIINLYN